MSKLDGYGFPRNERGKEQLIKANWGFGKTMGQQSRKMIRRGFAGRVSDTYSTGIENEGGVLACQGDLCSALALIEDLP